MDINNPSPFQYAREFEVMSFQVDPSGSLRLAALGDLMQEVAWKHADSREFGQALFDQGLIWVLSRMEIQILQRPKWGERILIQTAGRGIDKLFAMREFLVTDERGNEVCRAMSAWLLLDIHRKRPQRPNQVLPEDLFKQVESGIWMPEKVVITGVGSKVASFSVNPSDLDMNNHVNNVGYIRWVEDACVKLGIICNKLLLNYQMEARLGELMEIYFHKGSEHHIFWGEVEGKKVFSAAVE